MSLPIYILSIPRLDHRCAVLRAALQDLDLSFEVVPGFDRLETAGNGSGDLSLGDHCCSLGHRRIWERIATGTGPALVLEDDAAPSPKLRDWVESQALAAMSKTGADIFKLEAWGGTGLNRTRPLGRKTTVPGVYHLAARFVGSVAYVLTPAAARRGLSLDLSSPADHQLFAPPFQMGKVIFAADAPVLHDVARWGSDIVRQQGQGVPRGEIARAWLRGARRVSVSS